MKSFYFGNVDTIKQQQKRLPVIRIDGSEQRCLTTVFDNVQHWLTGHCELELANCYDIPNRDGIYLCTDAEGRVRYGQVMATAAGCFRFQEQYRNGGVTTWYDKASAETGTVTDDQLDMNVLSNWMLLLPTVSNNSSDHSMYPEEYTPNTRPTKCSLSSRGVDHHPQRSEEKQKEQNSIHQYYKWVNSLSEVHLETFATKIANHFMGGDGDENWTTDELMTLTVEEWDQFIRHTGLKRMDTALRTRDMFVIARTAYYRIIKRTPGPHAYYDQIISKVE